MHLHSQACRRIDPLRAVLFPNCREMARHSSRALETALPWYALPGIHLHLVFCRLCRRYRKQLRWLRRAARQTIKTETRSGGLPAGARERLTRALREQTFPSTPGKSSVDHPD